MTYCDSSFLVSLYIKRDGFHLQASRIAVGFQDVIPYTLLAELELMNGVRRNLAAKLITQFEYEIICRQILTDESDGILVRCALNQVEHYARARELSKKFTPEIAARSLNILHVAAALQLKATEFASFDEKQRLLAEKTGLKAVPKTIARKSNLNS
jgi:uncharacterized protein